MLKPSMLMPLTDMIDLLIDCKKEIGCLLALKYVLLQRKLSLPTLQNISFHFILILHPCSQPG